jgi:hypothetical protein
MVILLGTIHSSCLEEKYLRGGELALPLMALLLLFVLLGGGGGL